MLEPNYAFVADWDLNTCLQIQKEPVDTLVQHILGRPRQSIKAFFAMQHCWEAKIELNDC